MILPWSASSTRTWTLAERRRPRKFTGIAREDNPAAAVLKLLEQHGLLDAIHPQLARRKPDYDSLNKLTKARFNLMGAGLRPRTHLAAMYSSFGRLKPREATSVMKHLEFRANEVEAIEKFVAEAP